MMTTSALSLAERMEIFPPAAELEHELYKTCGLNGKERRSAAVISLAVELLLPNLLADLICPCDAPPDADAEELDAELDRFLASVRDNTRDRLIMNIEIAEQERDAPMAALEGGRHE